MRIRKAKEDFTYAGLPHNRKQAFKDIVKMNWRLLLGMASLFLLAFLPVIAVIFFRDNYCLGISIKVNGGDITPHDGGVLIRYAHLFGALGTWLSLYFSAIVISGLLRIYRQIAWYEPLFFKEDFVRGIKDNYKPCAITFTFFGLLMVACKLSAFVTENQIIQAIPVGISLAFIVPPLTIALFQSTVYSGGYFTLLRNGSLFYIKDALRVILFSFILYAPLLLELIESFFPLKHILALVAVFFVLPFSVLAYQLFMNYTFDKFINAAQYPELVNKGVFVDKEKEESK